MTTPEALGARLQALLGTPSVRTEDARLTEYAMAAQTPWVVVQPETIEQTQEVLTLAGRERLAVVPWGQGTHMHLGALPRRYDLALSLVGLSRIIEYDVANLTLIAEAGLPLQQAYRVSIPERQFVPLGFPGSRASLGGLVVTNTSGVKRSRYGALRDVLLGMRVALPDGSLVRFGGRVVKNVAGYDMNKLFIGSLGVFGVVVETTWRLAALPEDDRLLAVVFPSLHQATAAAAAIQASQLLPTALTLWSAEAMATLELPLTLQPEQVAVLVNVDGLHEAVARQIRDSRTYAQHHAGLDETLVLGEALFTLWERQERWQEAPQVTEPARLQLRLGALPSHLEDVIRLLITPQTFCHQDIRWYADYPQGQIFAHIPLEQSEAGDIGQAVVDWLAQLRTQLQRWHGYCAVQYAPAGLRQQLDMWGEIPGSQLLRLYKHHFDPHGVLNPGRYAAGL